MSDELPDLDPDWESRAIESDIKELTHECKVCSGPGILMAAGAVEDMGEYHVWYCEEHVDYLLADAAFCAAMENDVDGGPVTTEALAVAYLRRLGWSDARISEHYGRALDEE